MVIHHCIFQPYTFFEYVHACIHTYIYTHTHIRTCAVMKFLKAQNKLNFGVVRIECTVTYTVLI